jgi:hypothetical protein
MNCQNPERLNRDNFGTISGLPLVSPRTNGHLDVAFVEWCSVNPGKRGGGGQQPLQSLEKLRKYIRGSKCQEMVDSPLPKMW